MANIPNDYIDVIVPTTKDKVLKELRDLEAEYHSKGTPFDRYGALNDFEDYIKQWETEAQRAEQRKQTPPPFKKDWNWRKYGEKNRWVAETEWKETPSPPNNRTGQSQTIFIYEKKYTSISGGTVTITISQKQYEELQSKKK